MRTNSKTMIATGAAGIMLLGLTACGPTAVEEDPSDDTSPGVEQPVEPAPGNDMDDPTDDDTDMPGMPDDDEETTSP